MQLKLNIDPNVTFTFKDGREVTLDAYELFEMERTVRELHTKIDETDGKGWILFSVMASETQAFVKEATGIDLKASEAIEVFQNATRAWTAKKKSWEEPTEDLPTSPPSTALSSLE